MKIKSRVLKYETSQSKYQANAVTIKLFLRTLERSKLIYHRLSQIDKGTSKYLKGIPCSSSLLNNGVSKTQGCCLIAASDISQGEKKKKAYLKDIYEYGV